MGLYRRGGSGGRASLTPGTGYLRMAAAEVIDVHLDLPTPCADWDLSSLVAHSSGLLPQATRRSTVTARLASTSIRLPVRDSYSRRSGC